MKVDKNIKSYMEQQEVFSIPQLQVEFSMSYYDARRIVATLLNEKFICFNGGIEYKVVCVRGKFSSSEKDKNLSPWDRFRQQQEENAKKESDDNNGGSDAPDGDKKESTGTYREMLERRRQELIRRMRDFDDDDDEIKDDTDFDEEFDFVKNDLPMAVDDERNITRYLYKLIKSDREMTRSGAIKRVEENIEKARSKGLFNGVIFLTRVLGRLTGLTDYRYKKLREKLCGGEE